MRVSSKSRRARVPYIAVMMAIVLVNVWTAGLFGHGAAGPNAFHYLSWFGLVPILSVAATFWLFIKAVK